MSYIALSRAPVQFTDPAGHFDHRPTLEEMATLRDGEYYKFRKGGDAERTCFAVAAKYVDDKQLGYTCPFCWTKCKKNGQRHAQAQRKTRNGGDGTGCQ